MTLTTRPSRCSPTHDTCSFLLNTKSQLSMPSAGRVCYTIGILNTNPHSPFFSIEGVPFSINIYTEGLSQAKFWGWCGKQSSPGGPWHSRAYSLVFCIGLNSLRVCIGLFDRYVPSTQQRVSWASHVGHQLDQPEKFTSIPFLSPRIGQSHRFWWENVFQAGVLEE